MEQNDAPDQEYPRGRGYGQDYMRGGEVFGGYGYRDRGDYVRPRGSETEVGAADAALADEDITLRFPQDAPAGAWPVPHDLETAAPDTLSTDEPPVPQIEHTFGDTGGNRIHSRSYYVTQAQLQQRVVRARPDDDSPR